MSDKVPNASGSTGSAQSARAQFHDAARRKEQGIVKMASDAVVDGYVSPIESAMIDKTLSDYECDLQAYINAREKIDEAIDQVVNNTKA